MRKYLFYAFLNHAYTSSGPNLVERHKEVDMQVLVFKPFESIGTQSKEAERIYIHVKESTHGEIAAIHTHLLETSLHFHLI